LRRSCRPTRICPWLSRVEANPVISLITSVFSNNYNEWLYAIITSSWRMKAGFPGLRADRTSSWSRCHISKLLFDGKWHRVTPDYSIYGWCKAFRIVDGEHWNTRPNVLEPRCVQTLATWHVRGIAVFVMAPARLGVYEKQ
jgi:hypothetical protein